MVNWALIATLCFKCVMAFNIVETEVSKPQGVYVGHSVELKCKTNEWYEFCVWRHRDRVCKFEWKMMHNEVKEQVCTALGHKIEFIGNYNAHECEIRLLSVSPIDAGVWSCEMESYVPGVGSGYSSKASLHLKVITDPTTTSTSTTTQDGSLDYYDYSGDDTTTSIPTSTIESDWKVDEGRAETTNVDDFNTEKTTTEDDFETVTSSVVDLVQNSTNISNISIFNDLDSITDPSEGLESITNSTERSGNTTAQFVVLPPQVEEEMNQLSNRINAGETVLPDGGGSKLPLVTIILATTGGIFVLMIILVMLLHKKRQKYDLEKDLDKENGGNKTEHRLEMNAFVSTSDNSTSSEDDSNVKYVGCKSYNFGNDME